MAMLRTVYDYFKIVLILFSIKNVISDECDKYGILFYEDIGCQAVKTETENCPITFKCDLNKPKSGCSFKGKHYGLREEIISNLTYSGCRIGCHCDDLNSIRCAILDCPEWLKPGTGPGCYNEYVLGECCSIGEKCNVTKEAKKCKVNGKSYEIGSKFYPENTCLSCVCHENFNGKLDEKTCIRQNCVTQIDYSDEINKKCAPAYFKDQSEEVLCCPSDFICPDSEDKIKLINFQANSNSTLECDFGNQKLKLGEGLHRKVEKYGKERNFKCECILPPLLTCIES